MRQAQISWPPKLVAPFASCSSPWGGQQSPSALVVQESEKRSGEALRAAVQKAELEALRLALEQAGSRSLGVRALRLFG